MSDKPKVSAFTLKYSGRVRTLRSDVSIAELFDVNLPTEQQVWKQFDCIWDTGATGSAISSRVVEALNLKPTGKVICRTAGGEKEQYTYLVNVRLPNGLKFGAVKVTGAEIEGFDALIGMDIIAIGDFAVTFDGTGTVMSYQYPPAREPVDFVAEYNRKQLIVNSPRLSEEEKRKRRNRRKRSK